MKIFSLIALLVALLLQLYAPSANALTMKQFSDICHSSPGSCTEHPLIQAYVGGALDLLATLDEKTDYLQELYCGEPKELFDVAAIIQFMLQHSEQYSSENAMLVVVRYFEERGGCDQK
jgi:hypothetical protein